MVFDKTGTLTHGKQEVVALQILIDTVSLPWKLFLLIVGTAETNSEHPLGKSLRSYVANVSQYYIVIK